MQDHRAGSTLFTDTICATATAPGVGGVAIVRISGPKALEVSQKIFIARSEKQRTEVSARRAIYGDVWVGEELLDDGLMTYFPAPNSYTGEDVVEIACHGSTYIRQSILEALCKCGARMAGPGEFTQRAYLNGRMDLSRAEAVADIIASESRSQHQMALRQLRGSYSNELNALRDDLLKFTALMELELDFAEEDVTFADRGELIRLSETIEQKLSQLIKSYRLGNVVRKGIPVAIIGATNVGKSTLLNALLGEERAIVSDIHGTTRDTVEETLNLGGYLFRFVDTAGLRATEDVVESIGIERSRQKAREADIVLALLDASRLEDVAHLQGLKEILPYLQEGSALIPLVNKSEGLNPEERARIEHLIQVELPELGGIAPLFVSAKSGEGLEALRNRVVEVMEAREAEEADVVVSNARHYDLLRQALDALLRMRQGLDEGLPTDLLTPELRYATTSIGEITGETISREDTLHYIFAHFCIGK